MRRRRKATVLFARPRPLGPTAELGAQRQAVVERLGRARDTIHPDNEQVPGARWRLAAPPERGPDLLQRPVLTCDAQPRVKGFALACVLFRNVDLPELSAGARCAPAH